MSTANKAVAIKKGIFGEDPYLLAPKLLYFFVNCVFYSVHGLIGIFFIKKCGLSATNYAFVSSVAAINFVGAIVWSHIADKTGAYKTILATTIMLYAIIFSLQGFDFEKTVFPMFGVEFTITKLVWVLVVINTVANFISSAIFPILDNVILGMLAQNPSFSKEVFGRQRLFGAFGHAASTGASMAAQRLLFASEGKENKAAMFFVMIASALISTFLVIFAIPSGVHAPEHLKGHGHGGSDEKKKQLAPERSDTPHSTSSAVSAKDGTIGKNAMMVEQAMPHSATPAPPLVEIPIAKPGMDRSPVVILLTSPEFLFFLSFIFLAGYIRTVMGLFSAISIHNSAEKKDKAGKDVWYIFYSQGPKVFSEVLVYFFSKQIMGFFGYHWMLLVSQIAGIIRVFGYGLGDDPSLAMIWELLKGINTGLFFSSAVRIANEIAPKGCGNTAQGLMSGTYSGIASALAAIFSGLQISRHTDEKDGIMQMFVETAIGGSIVTALFFVKFAVFDRVILVGNRSSPSSKV